MDYQFKLCPIRCCIDMRNGSDHPRINLSPKGEHEANEQGKAKGEFRLPLNAAPHLRFARRG